MLPDEIVETLLEQFSCREDQIRQLAALYASQLASPSVAVVHGLEATGKTTIVHSFLKTSGLAHAVVSSRECITGRHLLERTLASCIDAVASEGEAVDRAPHARCESLSALSVHLQRLLDKVEQFVLVFDGIDRQREAPPTLLPALARIAEAIPQLSVVFIVGVPDHRALHHAGVPHLHFPPYTRDQSLQILTRSPLPIFTSEAPRDPEIEYTAEQEAEDVEFVWTRFCAAVWDSLGKGAARDIVSLRAVVETLWRPFCASIVDGTYGTRDFSKLMLAKRALFQNEDVLVERVIPHTPAQSVGTGMAVQHDLTYYSKYLLCAAYLASFNPARQDVIFFMKASEKKRKRRAGGRTPGRPSKSRKIPRHLLNPSPFTLERLLAILRAIVPHSFPQSADIYTQISTLTSLRLLVRSGTANADVLDPSCKWRVNFGWEYAAALGRSVNFEIADFLAGGGE